jgi:hypothetical protein
MNIGMSSADQSSQQQQQQATNSVANGSSSGSYSNGPLNAAQITSALDAAQGIAQNGTPTTNAGFSAINNGVNAATGLDATGNDALSKTLSGAYLSSGNPDFQGLITQIGQAIRPSIDGGFEANGRGGSGANANAFASALTNTAGQLGFQNYTNERQIQNNDITALPSYTAGLTLPGQTQVAAGYQPLDEFIRQLQSVSPGTSGNYSQAQSSNTSGTGVSSGSGSGSSSGFNAGAKVGK